MSEAEAQLWFCIAVAAAAGPTVYLITAIVVIARNTFLRK